MQALRFATTRRNKEDELNCRCCLGVARLTSMRRSRRTESRGGGSDGLRSRPTVLNLGDMGVMTPRDETVRLLNGRRAPA